MKAPHTLSSQFEDSGQNRTRSPRSALLNLVKRFWQAYLQAVASRDEPTVWQQTNQNGRSRSWHVYDPMNGRAICFGSELEVRLWLERRYYR